MSKNQRQFNLLDSPADNGISCSVYSSFDEVETMQKEWDEFVESVGGDIYLTYDWCRVWWQFYGENRTLRVFVYKVDGVLVGLIPMFYERVWLGPVWLKLSKIVGSDFTIAMVNPPIKSGYEKCIYQNIIQTLITKERCDAISFGPMSGRYNGLQHLRHTAECNSGVVVLKDSIRSPHTIFFFPESFDEYMRSLSKNQRGNLRRDRNLISRCFQVTQDIVYNEAAVESEFQKFIQMHNEQWQSVNKLGHFNDWPLGTEFQTCLVNVQSQRGRVRLVRLLFDDQVVSYQLCYQFGARWYWRLPARLVGSQWEKFALGRVGLVMEFEAAISEGINEIEAGAGHYDYKVKLGGQEYPLFDFVLVKKNWLYRLRTLVFLEVAKWVHFCYYRIWFKKLAPKLPFKQKHLSKLWIRTRI